MSLNPNAFQSLKSADLLARAAELQRVDPATASLLRWAALEIDSLRDANLEAHGVTVIDRPAVSQDGAEAVSVSVTLIEAKPDPVYGHTFKLPKFPPESARDDDFPRLLTLS